MQEIPRPSIYPTVEQTLRSSDFFFQGPKFFLIHVLL